jgi:acyl carrier protein
MGLDTVELVMAIEEEFEIRIEDADAAKLAVMGDIHAYVVQALEKGGVTPDADQIWKRLTAVVVKQLGVKPEQVTRSAHIVYDLHAD